MIDLQQRPEPQQFVNPPQPLALRVIANAISYICHPVFMPVVMTFVIYKLAPHSFDGFTEKQLKWGIMSIGFTTAFFPLFSILLMKPLGFLSSYHMPTIKDRIVPLMISMIFYFWINHVAGNIPGTHVPIAVRVLLLGNFWGLIGVFMINIFTKISMHTAAAGSMVGVIIVLMIVSNVNMAIPLFVSLVIAGIIGTARMIVGAHQRGDVWLGYIIGILAQLSAYIYLK